MRNVSQHAARRKLLARPFSKSSLLANFQQLVIDRARVAVSKMKEDATQEEECDIMKWWTLMTTDVISQVAFGVEPQLLEAGKVSSCASFPQHHGGGLRSRVLQDPCFPELTRKAENPIHR
jgi:cytochrome P450